MNSTNIGIILLAAGDSSRMGQSKQLLPIDGQPLLLKSLSAALDTGAKKIVVVLGANLEEHKKVITGLPIHIVQNLNWQKGMGSSIKAGLNSMLDPKSSLNAIIILVCDQPFLSSDHIKKIIEQHIQTRKTIVASGYAGTAGVPALFEKSMFKELLALEDEQGAKNIIKENYSNTAIVDFPEGCVDLDTMDDYNRFKKKKI